MRREAADGPPRPIERRAALAPVRRALLNPQSILLRRGGDEWGAIGDWIRRWLLLPTPIVLRRSEELADLDLNRLLRALLASRRPALEAALWSVLAVGGIGAAGIALRLRAGTVVLRVLADRLVMLMDRDAMRLMNWPKRAPFELSDLAWVRSMPPLELEVLADRFVEDSHRSRHDNGERRRTSQVPKRRADH
ncbi:MAG: hypothetical protein ACYCX7_09545 [Solirubrobacteraceae bacterium]